MRIVRTPERISRDLGRAGLKGKTIGLVPTMGALHEGHLSLMRKARKDNDVVVVSIFVNPAQFGPKEDLRKYPRPLSRDLALCKKERVDFVFLPRGKDMHPKGFSTFVDAGGLGRLLCGKSRPGHFRGVATVVAKLFNIIRPDTAYFGQKDAQQAVIIKRMAEDLNIPVKVKVMPTVRAKDGLALSSRNAYLSRGERQDALVLAQALNLAKFLIKNGGRDTRRIISRMRQVMLKKTAKIDYIEIVDLDNLMPLKKINGRALVVLAAFFGKTRLIDNLIIRGA